MSLIQRGDRKIGAFSRNTMMEAIALVEDGYSLNSVAKQKGLAYPTLRRYWKKKQSAIGPIRLTPNYAVKKIFTTDQEKSLLEYFLNCSRMFYGLPLNECRKIAYETAVINNIKIPQKWHIEKRAGKEWIRGFRLRNAELSLCTLSRANSINRSNVNIFYDDLYNIITRLDSIANGSRIFNLDEISTLTGHKPQEGLIGQEIGDEKGTLVTTCCIICASGQSIPPVIVFPSLHLKQQMLDGAPTGTLGLSSQNGLMNSEIFLEVMLHFIKHTTSTPTNPALLIYDNYEAHISVPVLNLAKENGVIILTIPPHSSSKMQPLDIAISKHFKAVFNCAIDLWMARNPDKLISIYEIASCVGIAYQRAVTPSNIISAFKKTGIHPFDRILFTDVDFMPSLVTDRSFESRDKQTPFQLLPTEVSSIILEMLVAGLALNQTLPPIQKQSIDHEQQAILRLEHKKPEEHEDTTVIGVTNTPK